MEFKVNDISQSEREVEVTLTYDEIRNEIDAEVKKEASKIQISGFRKGKVPMHIIKQRFGDSLEYEASEHVANSRFWKLAQEHKLNPIGQPVMTDIDFKPGEDFKFKVKFETLPELKIKNYTNQLVEVPEIIVKDEEVENEINYIRRAYCTTEETGFVGDDNYFLLDTTMIRLNEKEEPYENSKPEKLQIDLTNPGVHPDVKERAKGKKVGDKFTFSFTDERTVTNEKKGQETIKENFTYEVTVNGIKKIILPELDEELIKKVTKNKASTESELRNEINNNIQNYYIQRTEEFTRNSLISIILKANDFTPPSVLVNDILNEMVKTEEQRLKNNGVKKIDQKQLWDYFLPMAVNDVKWYLIKNEIMKLEKIEITDAELEEQAKIDAEKTGLPVEKLFNYYKSSNQNEKNLDKKLFDFLKENNNIVKVNPDKFLNKKKEMKNEKQN